MDEVFLESADMRFTSQGETVFPRFNVSRLSNYGFAKVLRYMNLQDPKLARELFMHRISHVIKSALTQRNLMPKKPSKKEKVSLKEEHKVFTTIFQNNLPQVIGRCLDNPPKSKLKYVYKEDTGEPLTRDQKQLNEAIFNLRIQRTISNLAFSAGVKAVCQDYKFVKEVVSNPSRFNELELMCKGPLSSFMTSQRIRYVPAQDQYQEGLLAVWNSAKAYEGRGFARFTTLARASLKNKFANLIRYFIADKRRIHKKTSPMGSATNPEESFLAQQADTIAYLDWANMQRLQLTNGANQTGSDYSPFLFIQSDASPIVRKPGEGALGAVFEETYEEVHSENFPHLNERQIETIPAYKIRDRRIDAARLEFISKCCKGESYIDEQRILRVKNPSSLIRELEEEDKEIASARLMGLCGYQNFLGHAPQRAEATTDEDIPF